VAKEYHRAGPDRDHPLAVIVIDAEVEVAIGVETAGIVIEVEIAARHRVIDIDHQDGIGNRVTIVPNLDADRRMSRMMRQSLGPGRGMTIQEIDLETVSAVHEMTAVLETTDAATTVVMIVVTIAGMTDAMIAAVTIDDSSHFRF